MRDAELEIIESAVEQRDEVAIDAAGRRVGMKLSLAALVQLRSRIRGSLTLRDVLLTMAQARAEQIAVREVLTEPMRKVAIGYAKEICLAVLHDGGITVGVQRVRNKPLGVGDAWPALEPWFKDVARNRGRAQAWANAAADDRVCIPLHDGQAAVPDDIATLRAAIVENPEDDELRRVLADRLLEREDAHGELIRRALELREQPEGLRRQELQREYTALEDMHGSRIAGEVARLADSYELAGGFVDALVMSAPAFKKHGERLLQSHPIRRFSPKPWNDAAARTLAATPHLGRVRHLELGLANGKRGVVAIAPLAGASFERLETLALRYTSTLGADGAACFSALVAPRLRRLEISSGFLGAGALHGLACNKALCAGLEEFTATRLEATVGDTQLEDDADVIADAAFEELALPALRHLRLHWTWFQTDARVAKLVARSPLLESIQVDGPMTGPMGKRTLDVLRGYPNLRIITSR